MKPTTSHPLSDDELHALVDAQGTPDSLAKLGARLSCDAQAQLRLAQWQLQRDALRSLHVDMLDQPLPSALVLAAEEAEAAFELGSRWWRYGGVAAGVFLAFGAGWMANSSWQHGTAFQSNQASLARVQFAHEFVHQASLAHSVYVPEVRHPVEVTAVEQSHLVQWLSKRLGKPLKVPDLTAQGFELVGGRLLPGDTGPRAQFMFQNATGSRVTLYLGALDGTATADLSNNETGFRYASQAGVPSFYWVDQGFGYALAGQLPRETLMKLANLVYRQLCGAPAVKPVF